MPLLGVIFYFSKSPRFFPEELVKAKLISIFILTFLLPILVFYLLKTLGKTDTIYLEKTRERILPLAINASIILLILTRVLPENQIIELYYFFIGILISTLACLGFALFKLKISIHMLSFTAVFAFAIGLAIHFSININGSLALMALLMGAVATSRLHLKAHSFTELILGCVVGAFPQFLIYNYWL
jgi:membrane-associated HD superfamily phosphohydrolase